MTPAAVLQVVVTANTAQANAALAKVESQMRGTAATGSMMGTRLRSGLKVGTLAILATAAAGAKLASDFNQQMTLIETQAGAPQGEIRRLREEVLKLSTMTEFAPKELAEGLFRVESAGFRGARALDILHKSAQLADVGQSNLESTTYAVVAALNSGIRGTKNMSRTVGTLNAAVGQGNMRMEDLISALGTGILPAGRAAGIGLRDVTSAIDVMTRTGTPATAAATRLRMTLFKMAVPGDSANEALSRIGLTQTSMAKAMRGPDGLIGGIQLLQDHLKGLDEVAQTQVISQIFGGGRTASGILILLQNLEQLKEIYGATGREAGKFHEKVRQQAETDAHKFEEFKNVIQVGLIHLGESVLPFAADAAERLTDIFTDPKLTAGGKIAEAMQVIQEEAGKLAAVLAKEGLKIGGALAVGIGKGFVTANIWGKLLTAAVLIRVFGGKGALTASGAALGRYIGVGVGAGMASSAATVVMGGGAAGAVAGGSLASRVGRRLKGIRWGRVGGIASGVALGTALIAGVQTAFQGGRGGGLGMSKVSGFANDWGVNIANSLGIPGGKLTAERFSEEFQKYLKAVAVPSIGRNKPFEKIDDIFSKEFWRAMTPDERQAAEFAAEASSNLTYALRSRTKDKKTIVSITDFISADPAGAGELAAKLRTNLSVLRSGVLNTAKDIQKIWAENQAAILRNPNLNGTAQRELMAANFRQTGLAMAKGMAQGLIPKTRENIQRVQELLRKSLLMQGKDPLGVAKAFARGWKSAGDISAKNIQRIIGDLKLMPPEARRQAAETMLRLAEQLRKSGKIPRKAFENLRSAIARDFGILPKKMGSITAAIAGKFGNLGLAINAALDMIKDNVNTALSAFGSTKTVKFAVQFIKSNFGWLTNKRGGIIPGAGDGDKVPVMAEPGEGFINKRATRALGGKRAIDAINTMVPRFQGGGTVGGFGRAEFKGPNAATGWLGEQSIGAVNEAAAAYYRRNAINLKGLGRFDGQSVAGWLVPWLSWTRKHGWGGSVTSGYRSFAEQAALYADPSISVVAPPGASRHQGKAWPSGAVDLSDYTTARGLIPGYPSKYKPSMSYPPGDPVHFSSDGHQRGGYVQSLQKGGMVRGSHWIHPKKKYHWTADEASTLLWQIGYGKRTAQDLPQVLPGESGGYTRADNPSSSAAGLYQILQTAHGAQIAKAKRIMDSGSIYDPRVNSWVGGDIWETEGPGAWEAGLTGPKGKIHKEWIGKNGGKPGIPKKLRKKIKKLKVSPTVGKHIRALTRQADIYDEYANRAGALEGEVFGLKEAEWLQKELTALFTLRNAIIRAIRIVEAKTAVATKLLGKTKNKKAKKLIREQLGKYRTQRGDLWSSLEDVQGIGSSTKRMAKLPAVGVLGGRIFDTQMRLKDLNAPAEATDGAPTGLTAAQLKEIGFLSTLGVKFNAGQFAGMFAGGGKIPAGMWGITGEAGAEITAGPATVTPVSDEPSVEVNVILPESLEWMRDQIQTEIKVADRTVKQSARARRKR